ncbi:phage tail tube protein [Desulfovibrio mangrovi]|uniref:phage tail tube protein n=1 Tax=Desulfovibrio mangrovi TaxID=2976983 RepID=UPI0022450275|nr:phage tail tube protein [Desulfovibrio mangrovi]UZP67712.1 phage tail tube protein [Desulfovibrio mangrovi]
MGQARGYKGKLLIGFEEDYGVAPATPVGFQVHINSVDGGATRALSTSDTITGTRNPAKPFSGDTALSRNIVVPLDAREIGLWLTGMLGAPVSSGTGPYTHVFKVGDTQPSMIIEPAFPDVGMYLRGRGCKVGSFEFTAGGSGEHVVNIGVVGQDESKEAAPYDATPTQFAFDRMEKRHIASIKEGGAAVSGRITEISMKFDMGLDTDGYTADTGGTLGDISEGLISISGSVTALFKDTTLFDKAAAGTETSLEITFTNGAHSLSFKLPETMYSRSSPAISGPQGVRESYDFQGYLDDAADGSAIVVTLTNDVASYALA